LIAGDQCVMHDDTFDYSFVMPDLRSLPRHSVSRGHPDLSWIPASAGMTECDMSYDVLYSMILIVALCNSP